MHSWAQRSKRQVLASFKDKGVVDSDFVRRDDTSDVVMLGCESIFATKSELGLTFRS